MQRKDNKRIAQEVRYQNKLKRNFANQQTFTKFNFNNSQQDNAEALFYVNLFLLLSTGVTMVNGQQMYKGTSQLNTPSTEPNTDTPQLTQTQSLINQTCSHKPFMAANKADIRYTNVNGGTYPLSCVKHLRDNHPVTQKCINDNNKVNEFNTKNPNEKKLREIDTERDKINWHAVTLEATKLANSIKFTPEQKHKFENYVDILEQLQVAHSMTSYAKKINAGNCHEHASYNAMRIFQINKEQKTFSKIQIVTVDNKHGSNHVYLLIDSEVKDIKISNNPSGTEKLLSNIQEGYICDSWHEGYYKEVSKNKNDFYRKWDSVDIKTMAPDYFDLNDLPKKAANFIKNKLRAYDLLHLIKQGNDNTNKPEL